MGFTESAEILLSHGADFTIIEKATGKTPLLIAAFGGHVEIGRLLVYKYNADMNVQLVQVSQKNAENVGHTALSICAEKGYSEFVELLIDNKANLEIKTKKGCSPLWLACSSGQLEVVQLLVSAGADVDSQDNRKVTCIMAAFRNGHIRVVRWLVKFITQFPSDNEMVRFISIITEEARKRPKICMDIINEEKSKQAAQANDIAQTLLDELNLEKMEEEAKKMGKKLAASKKRERKKQKRKETKVEEDVTKADNEKIKSKAKQSTKAKIEDEKQIEKEDEEEEEEEESKIETPEVVESSNISNKKPGKNSNKDRKLVENKDQKKEVTNQVSGKEAKEKEQNSKGQKSTTISNQSKQQQTKEKKKEPEPTVRNVEKSKTNEKASKKSTVNKSTEESAASTLTTEKGSSYGAKNLNLPANTDNLQSSANSSTINEKVRTSSLTSSVNSKQQLQKEDDWKEVVRRQKKIIVPANAISRVIGRGGCNIKLVREVSGAHIDIENQKNQGDSQQPKIVHGDRQIIIKGSNEATKNAYQLIQSLVNEPEKDINQILNQLGLSKPISTTLNESLASSKAQSSGTLTSATSTSLANSSTCAKQSTSAVAMSSQTAQINYKESHKYPQVSGESMLYKSNNSSNNSRKNSNTSYKQSSVAEHHDEQNNSSQRSSIWNLGNSDKAKDNLSKSNNRVELVVSTEPSTNQQNVTAQKETGYFSPFDSILGKVAQETIWQSTKEPVKPNFASVAAAGLNNNNNNSNSNNNSLINTSTSSSMNNYLTNSDNSLNKSFKKTKEIQVDISSKAPGYRPPTNVTLSPHHTSTSYQQQQQLGSSANNSSNTLNQIMINNFGPIGAKSAPCTPPLSTSAFSSSTRKDYFNTNNSNVQKLLTSPTTKAYNSTSGNHSFPANQYSTSSAHPYHQTKNYTSSNYSATSNRPFSTSHDSTSSSSSSLLQSTSDLTSSNEPLFNSGNNSSMQINTGYQPQIPMQANLQNASTQPQQTTTQPLASNLQIQMRAALLAAGAQLQLQQCMNPQLSGQNKCKFLIKTFFYLFISKLTNLLPRSLILKSKFSSTSTAIISTSRTVASCY